MSTSFAIRSLLERLPVSHIFTTRDLIGIGTRAAIDKCLHKLVRQGTILRLARGVFSIGDQLPLITPLDLAQIKARAFNKEIYEHPSITAKRLGYIPREEKHLKAETSLTYTTNGTGNTSFQSIFGTINLKSASARKRQQHRNEVWELVKALWNLKQGGITTRISTRIKEVWGRKSQDSLQSYCASIPQWLNEQLPSDFRNAAKAISLNLKTRADTELDKTCWCPDKGTDTCLCPMISCKHCQWQPLTNRFSIALG